MIRFIIRKRCKSCDSGEMISNYTMDLDVPELERALLSGGFDQYAYEHHDLAGFEILKSKEQNEKEEK